MIHAEFESSQEINLSTFLPKLQASRTETADLFIYLFILDKKA